MYIEKLLPKTISDYFLFSNSDQVKKSTNSANMVNNKVDFFFRIKIIL